jgi:diguanylate cyclase
MHSSIYAAFLRETPFHQTIKIQSEYMTLDEIMSKAEIDLKNKQALRKRRLAMASLTYLVPFSLVVLYWVQNMIPLSVVFHFAIYCVLISIAFFILFQSNINLKFSDPSLTAPQMTVSIIPALWVMYFLDDGQARAIFMLIIAIPLIYGILALNTRQFIKVGVAFFLFYSILNLSLWLTKPQVLNWPLEFIQAIAYILAIASSSIIGGFIYGLRIKLRERNRELKEAVARIEELVNTDSLTGVFNRRRLFEVLSQEANRYSRAQGPFSVCIMDIDYFKQVNDVHGHQAGDTILRELARNVSVNLRNIDCFGRYGGEEFLLVLPQTTLKGAAIKAERVRQQVESLCFSDISENLKVTVSIGVAEYRLNEDVDETLARADKRLYMAKDAGRNRVITEGSG